MPRGLLRTAVEPRGSRLPFVSEAAFEHFLATYRRRYGAAAAGPQRVHTDVPDESACTSERRTVYSIDLLGEAGMSVQDKPIRDADDQAHWLDDTLAGLGLGQAHLMGVSIGGWTAINHAVRQPGRAASLTLLDPVMTFAPIPVKPMLASVVMFAPGVPEAVAASGTQLD